MRKTFLPFSPPSLSDLERNEVMDTLHSDWITTGPKTKAFETKLKGYMGSPSVVALNSCTAGLHVGLVALGVGPGDEVIVPAMTFCATANVVEHVGARPILVDVCPDTLNDAGECHAGPQAAAQPAGCAGESAVSRGSSYRITERTRRARVSPAEGEPPPAPAALRRGPARRGRRGWWPSR